jgi:WS/DGAT/MGAT family acyltransferase
VRLSNQDASFLYGETASGPMHGAGFCVLDGVIPFETVVRHIESRLHLVPRYRQKLAFVPLNLAHAKWVDDPGFKIENHVRRYTLAPGSSMDDAVEKGLELAEPLLDRGRPLWLTYILEGVPDRTVMLSLAHHAMIDGVSGVDLSVVLMDLQRDAPPVEPRAEPWAPKPAPGALELAGEALRETLESLARPLALMRGARELLERGELLRRAGEVVTRLMSVPVIGAPWNAALVGPKRRLAWTRYDLSEFRTIRSAFGGTVNDVVLTVMTEAAARYLRFHGENTEGQRLRLMCPVSVRREGEEGTLGNRVSAMFPTLPAWPMNPVERLRAVAEETERLKRNREPQALELLMESALSMAPIAMAQTLLVGTPFDPTAWLARVPPPVPPRFGPRPPHFGFNFTVTNVPGVQFPLFMAGREMTDLVGSIMLTGVLGYGVAIGSYNKKLYFSLTSDPRLMPDVDRMRYFVDDVFGELLDAARSATAAAAAC